MDIYNKSYNSSSFLTKNHFKSRMGNTFPISNKYNPNNFNNNLFDLVEEEPENGEIYKQERL